MIANARPISGEKDSPARSSKLEARSWLVRVSLLVLIAASVAVDETKKVEVVCPVDGTRFTATEIVRTDASRGWGGVDADGCPHAYRTFPMEAYIWTCPKCLFSGSKEAFDPKKPPDEALKAKLKGALRPAHPIKADAGQEEIPGWVKYDLTAQIEALRPSPPLAIALRHRSAAWAARQAGAARLDDFDEWVEASAASGLEKDTLDLGRKNRSDHDLAACLKLEKEVAAGKFKGTDLLIRRHLLAWTYRRRGENVDAIRWLDALARSKGDNSVIDESAALLRASIEAERGQQKKAAAEYARAIGDPSLDAKTRAECQYMLGEIARRTGEYPAAAEWYGKAIAATPDPALKKRAEAQKAKLP